VKAKVRPRQEFVVGGWQPGERGLAGTFGSLLLGVYEGDQLRYAGKVGTGYTDQERDRVGSNKPSQAPPWPPC
jgi:bifunctional non-homologous end joining protein LigD